MGRARAGRFSFQLVALHLAALAQALALSALLLAPTAAWAQSAAPAPATERTRLVVGSKRFTESYVLGELATQVLQAAGVDARHRQGLGNTGILEQALASGAVQVYPEYTGTIVRELLQRSDVGNPSLAQLNEWLAPRGLKAAVPLGFNNTYALALRRADAQRLGVTSISDLARLPAATTAGWRLGLSHEFLQRADGWPALQRAYGLPFKPGNGLDHGLAYQALRQGQVDLIDVYSTDAQLGRGDLLVLVDDRAFFPRYDAVLLMRSNVDETPLAAALAGRIDDAAMVAMNAAVELQGRSFAEVARAFLAQGRAPAGSASGAESGADAGATQVTAQHPAASFADKLFAPDLPRLLRQHLVLVFGSLALAVLVGVPLGVLAFWWPRWAGAVMGTVGVLQTVPSLALLALLIALLGQIGFVPALLALFVYALLPVVRNTHAGLAGVPAGLLLAARALGLRPRQVLRTVALPLALPMLLAGVKTAAVINVGTATVAAFIGAGGLGERIVAGLAVNDAQQMLAGALPAALLAVLVQWMFDFAERRWRPGPQPA
jgi:osmoprotectant transport system permease protein